ALGLGQGGAGRVSAAEGEQRVSLERAPRRSRRRRSPGGDRARRGQPVLRASAVEQERSERLLVELEIVRDGRQGRHLAQPLLREAHLALVLVRGGEEV